MRSSEPEGVCYVETKNLDGETNLKNKCVPKDLWKTFEHMEPAIKNFKATLNVDGPNNFIYKFEGCIEMQRESRLIGQDPNDNMQVPYTNDNVLLRGMSLRNTESVLGIVVYTGHETKIQMNTTKAQYKVSKMMKLTNIAVFWIFIIQCIFSIGGATYCAYWTQENMDNPYLEFYLGSENLAQKDLIYTIMTMTGSWVLIFW